MIVVPPTPLERVKRSEVTAGRHDAVSGRRSPARSLRDAGDGLGLGGAVGRGLAVGRVDGPEEGAAEETGTTAADAAGRDSGRRGPPDRTSATTIPVTAARPIIAV
jgi:hypothetical protein